MKQFAMAALLGLSLAGCGDPDSLDNIEFVKRNLENKNLHEKLLTIELTKERSEKHKALYQQISTSYNLLEQSKKEKDRFSSYHHGFLARNAYYTDEADYQAVVSAKKLEDVTGLYRRIEPYFKTEQAADFIYNTSADSWDIYSVIQQVKYNAQVLHAVDEGKNVKNNNNNPELRKWLDKAIARQYQELQEIVYILVQASETDKEVFYADKKQIEQDADRILAGVRAEKARQMLKPDMYAWQQKNLWRYELVNNTCMVLDEKIREYEIAKDCHRLLKAYEGYTIEPDEFSNFAAKSRAARNKLAAVTEELKERYNYAKNVKKVDLKPNEQLNSLMLSLKKDLYRATPKL
ncbi:hypothetical protein AAEU29_05850 [Pseudoalteromonas sp. SSM20]|uniref:hypothetical protein n=1 Tax=Pseudoalteromonas sp. SSM20 TaxID=3139394 RepID=UPI003BAA55D6